VIGVQLISMLKVVKFQEGTMYINIEIQFTTNLLMKKSMGFVMDYVQIILLKQEKLLIKPT